MKELKQKERCFSIKNYVGGPIINSIDRAESEIDYGIKSMLLLKLEAQNQITLRMRFILLFWILLANFLLMMPWSSYLGFIPQVGGIIMW